MRESLTHLARAALLVALLALAALVLLFAPVARAQDYSSGVSGRGLSRLERELALLEARIAHNEAGAPTEHVDDYGHADLVMIHNAAIENAGPSLERRIGWLRRHSRCVSGALSQDAAYQRPGRCRWTRNLTPDGRRPRGWPDGSSWSRERPRWLSTLRASIELVRGQELRVCPERALSWDGPRWADQLAGRGWVPMDCKGTRNLGVRRRINDAPGARSPTPGASDLRS